MIGKEDIIQYIEGAPLKKAKQLGIVMTAMLNEQQLTVLDAKFTKKVDFDPKLKREAKPKEEEPVAEEVPVPPVPEEVSDDLADLDFDFDEK